jgi:hypothetical protein
LNEHRGTYRPPDKRKRHHGGNSGKGNFHGRGPKQHQGQRQGGNPNAHRPNQSQHNKPPAYGIYDYAGTQEPAVRYHEVANQGKTANNKPKTISRSGRLPDGRFDLFELFCAYHLGITADGGYRQQNIHDLARRFNCSPAELRQVLIDHRLDSQSMINSDFDLSMAQIDIMVAPEGVDKRELARPFFDEYQKAHMNARDWNRELEEDAKQNAKIFGDDK